MAQKRTAESYKKRDEAIIRHLLRYRVGLFESWSLVFWNAPGKPVGSAAKKLEESGLISIHKRSLPGGISYCTPSKQAHKSVGKKGSDKPIGTAALDSALAILCYCTLSDGRRERLFHSELRAIFQHDTPAANIAHVVNSDQKHPAILRVYRANGAARSGLGKLRTQIEETRKRTAIRPWLVDGDYGFLALCPSMESASALRRAVEKSGLQDLAPRIDVAYAPTASSLGSYLRARKQR